MHLKDNHIFIFGSNILGKHGAGAALFAKKYRGAIDGVGYGIAGHSFAIPTKGYSYNLRTKKLYVGDTLPLEEIKSFVEGFLAYAKALPFVHFKITRLGTGLAGLKDEQIAPMFEKATPNCFFDEAWKKYLPEHQFWGTF